jgi:ferredoxin
VEDKARLDESVCRGCEACLAVCPVNALQTVLEIEAVPVASPVLDTPKSDALTLPRAGVAATLIVAGTALATRAAPLVLHALGDLLTRSHRTRPVTRDNLLQQILGDGRGRRVRRRQRGRW